MPQYVVIGPRTVDGVEQGGTLTLEDDDERTRALVRAGHVERKTKTEPKKDEK